jgi:hypothetical protein
MAARIRCNLITLLLPTLSGTVGIAHLDLLTGPALPKGLLHASSCMPIQQANRTVPACKEASDDHCFKAIMSLTRMALFLSAAIGVSI